MPSKTLTAAICGATLVAAMLVGGCGAKDAAVLKTAFARDIDSANVSIVFDVHARSGDVRLALDGPYRSNGEDELPSVDWRMKLDGVASRSVEGRVVADRGNAFVQYAGKTYEVGEDEIAKLERQGADEPTLSATDVRELMRQAQDWFPESEGKDAQLDGEAVTRVSGKLDLSAALTEAAGHVRRRGAQAAQRSRDQPARDDGQ